MEPRSLQFIADACGGRILRGAGDLTWRGVSTDSRTIEAGNLFWALAGERFDGHHFLTAAVRRGAAAVVVERGDAVPADLAVAAVQVDASRAALGRLAAAHREGMKATVVAVAGSNGKTTTKEILAAVLRRRFRVHASPASYNNDVGVPLTLLGIEAGHEAAIVEVGTNHPGELAPLLRMVRPLVGILTGVGREHLEFLGSLEGVAEEEGWLAELLPAEGRLVLPGDTPFADRILRRSPAPAIRVGTRAEDDWRLLAATPGVDGVTFEVRATDSRYSGLYEVPLLGRHQARNALLALAVAAGFGLTREELQQGLASCRPAPHRLENWVVGGVRVLDDSYNANADSMIAALETLRDYPCAGRRIAVLGDMGELGASSDALHAEVGRKAAELPVDQLFAVGRMAGVLGEAARAAGLKRTLELYDVEAMVGALTGFVRPGDVLLIKASRTAGLERIADHFRPRTGA